MGEGKKQGRVSFWGEVSGISPLNKAFSSPLRSLKSLLDLRLFKLLFGDAFQTYSKVYGDAAQRFSERMAAENVSGEQINHLYTVTALSAGLFIFLSALAWLNFAFFAIAVSVGIQNSHSLPQDLYVLLFPLSLSTLAIRDSVRAYQLRYRELVSFREFLVRIFTNGSPPKSKGKITVSAVLTILVPAGISWLLFPHYSFAATTGMVDVGSASTQISNAYGFLADLGTSDLSGQWLARLFPSVTGASNGDMLSDMLVTFNTDILDVGAGVMFSQATFSFMHAAQAGGFAQTQMNPPIAALRALGGGAALFPIKGGYCLLQILTLQLLAGGYWIADSVYDDMLTVAFSATSVASAAKNLPAGDETALINNVLSAETCYAWYQQNGTVDSTLAIADAADGESPYSVASTNDSTSLPWEGLSNSGSSPVSIDLSECGTITVDNVPTDATNTGAAQVFNGASTFNASRNAALSTLMSSVWSSGLPKSLMQEFTANGGVAPGATPPIPAASSTLQSEYAVVTAAAATYLDAVQTAAATMASSGLTAYASAQKSTGDSLGWVSAGALYSAISQTFGAATMGIDGSVPSLVVNSLDNIAQDDRASIQNAYSQVDVFMTSKNVPQNASFSTNNGAMAPTAPTSGVAFNDEQSAQRILDEPAAAISFRLNNHLLLDPANPIASVMEEGEFFMHSAMIGLATSYIASKVPNKALAPVEKLGELASGANPVISAIGDGFGFLTKFAVDLLLVMLLLGAFEVYVIPMLFYIYWMFEIVSCIAFAAELVLAAPIAAFLLMRTNGRDPISQEQRQFFVNAFVNGMLKPSLLLFGLAISSYVLAAISGVLNTTFNLAIASAQGSSIIGPVGIFVNVVMLVYLQWQLCNRSIHLISTVPEAVAQLLGASFRQNWGQAGTDTIIAGFSRHSVPGIQNTVGKLMAPPKNTSSNDKIGLD